MRRLVQALFTLAVPLAACGAPDDRLPRARDQRIATTEDQPVELLLDADDPDGDPLTWTAGEPAHGTLVLDGGRATYTPDPDFHGTDHVEVTVTGGELSARSIVVFDVGAAPDAPRLMHDTFPAGEDEPLYLATHALLANDRDPDGDALRVTDVEPINGGDIRLADGEVVFTPTSDRTGMARFQYAVTDGLHTATAEVILRVGASNDAPVTTDDHLATVEDEPVTVAGSVLLRNDHDPDGDSLSITEVLGALGGRVELDELDVRFVPAPNFTGVAGFAYRVSDGAVERQAWVNVAIDPVDDLPVASALLVVGTEDEVVVLPFAELRAHAEDGDGDPLTVVAVDDPVAGVAALINDEIRFWPAVDVNGDAGYRYTLSDGVHESSARVLIMLDPVDDPPVALPQYRAVRAGDELTITMTGHDVDDPSLAFQVTAAPRHGTLRHGAAANQVVYQPDPAFAGDDELEFVVHAGGRVSPPARIGLLVRSAAE